MDPRTHARGRVLFPEPHAGVIETDKMHWHALSYPTNKLRKTSTRLGIHLTTTCSPSLYLRRGRIFVRSHIIPSYIQPHIIHSSSDPVSPILVPCICTGISYRSGSRSTPNCRRRSRGTCGSSSDRWPDVVPS